MQNDLIEKYLNNKHKALLSYASVLYRVYPSVGDSLWKSEEEYHGIISNVLNTYMKKYYLRDADELNSFNQCIYFTHYHHQSRESNDNNPVYHFQGHHVEETV